MPGVPILKNQPLPYNLFYKRFLFMPNPFSCGWLDNHFSIAVGDSAQTD